MASTSGIKAGKAFVELGVSDKLAKGLAAAQKKLQAFAGAVTTAGKYLAGIGAAAIGGLFVAAESFGRTGDAMLAMSARTGIAVESLSELQYTGGEVGVSIENVETSIRKMQKAIGEAAQGSDQASEALGKLGLSASQLQAVAPDQQFEMIADRLSAIQDPATRAALAMEVFGKSGTSVLPMIALGSKGIDQLREKARKFGIVITTEAAERADAFDDALGLLRATLSAVSRALGEAIVPMLTDFATRAAAVVANITRWIKTHKDLIVTAFKVALAVTGIGLGLITLGVVISKGLAFISALGSAVSFVTGTIGVLGTIISGALLSPLGLLAVAALSAGAAFLYFSGYAGKSVEWLGGKLSELIGWVSDLVGGVIDALRAGDIQLAARILWLGLQVAWEEGTALLQRVWLAGKQAFLTTFYGMWYGALALAETVWHGLEVGWIETTSFLSSTWEKFTSFVSLSWETIKNLASKAWNYIKGLFDEDFNVEAANLAADQALVAAEQRLEDQKNAALQEIEAARQDKREQTAKEHEATMAQIGSAYEQSVADLASSSNKKIEEAKAQLAGAKAALAQSIAQAKQKREASDRSKDLESPDWLAKAQDLLDGLDLAGAKIGVTGTFNAAGVAGLGAGSDAQERTAVASERIAKNTDKMARQRPPAFA